MSGRKKLSHLLGETKRGESDRNVRDLINFLRASLDKGYPFCDIFDPILSDVNDMLIDARSASNFIIEPEKHVVCSLSNVAKVILNQEMIKRRNDIENTLQDHLCFDANQKIISRNSFEICALAGHVRENVSQDMAKKVLSYLTNASLSHDETLFQTLKNKI